MELSEFEIGKEFYVLARDGFAKWRCTDIGTKNITLYSTILAITQ